MSAGDQPATHVDRTGKKSKHRKEEIETSKNSKNGLHFAPLRETQPLNGDPATSKGPFRRNPQLELLTAI